MSLQLPKYSKEYCCAQCGLIWFAEKTVGEHISCPECNESEASGFLYDCNSMSYAYAYDNICKNLKSRNKEIHFHKDHEQKQKDFMESLYR